MRQGGASDSPPTARCTLRRLVQRIYRHMPNSYQYVERVALSTFVLIQRNPEQRVTIQLQWAVILEWLPSVAVNQHANHITTSTDRVE